MHQYANNGIKDRLIERAPMTAEIMRLMVRGIPRDQIAIELARLFYIDVDLLNDVLKELPEIRLQDEAVEPATEEEKRRAAA